MIRTNCVNCGCALSVGAKKCPYCGTPYANAKSFEFTGEKTVKIRYFGKELEGYVAGVKMYTIPNCECERDASGRLVIPMNDRTVYEIKVIAEEVK